MRSLPHRARKAGRGPPRPRFTETITGPVAIRRPGICLCGGGQRLVVFGRFCIDKDCWALRGALVLAAGRHPRAGIAGGSADRQAPSHDPISQSILITDDAAPSPTTERAVEAQLSSRHRRLQSRPASWPRIRRHQLVRASSEGGVAFLFDCESRPSIWRAKPNVCENLRRPESGTQARSFLGAHTPEAIATMWGAASNPGARSNRAHRRGFSNRASGVPRLHESAPRILNGGPSEHFCPAGSVLPRFALGEAEWR